MRRQIRKARQFVPVVEGGGTREDFLLDFPWGGATECRTLEAPLDASAIAPKIETSVYGARSLSNRTLTPRKCFPCGLFRDGWATAVRGIERVQKIPGFLLGGGEPSPDREWDR